MQRRFEEDEVRSYSRRPDVSPEVLALLETGLGCALQVVDIVLQINQSLADEQLWQPSADGLAWSRISLTSVSVGGILGALRSEEQAYQQETLRLRKHSHLAERTIFYIKQGDQTLSQICCNTRTPAADIFEALEGRVGERDTFATRSCKNFDLWSQSTNYLS